MKNAHLFWGMIVLVVAFLGAYVGLTVAGYAKAADDISTIGFVLGFFIFFYASVT